MPALEDNDQTEANNFKEAGDSDKTGWDEMRTTIEELRAEILRREDIFNDDLQQQGRT